MSNEWRNTRQCGMYVSWKACALSMFWALVWLAVGGGFWAFVIWAGTRHWRH